MKKIHAQLIALSLLAAATASRAASCDANAGNLVGNCGFETGDFTGWTLAGDQVPAQQDNLYGVEMGNGGVPIDPDPHGGDFQAYFGGLVSNATTLSQSLSTTPSSTYLVSFYLAQDAMPNSGPAGMNQLIASFGNQTVTLDQVPVQGYTLESFMAMASSTSTSLSITMGNGLGYFLLDDISVTNVPEPASEALAAMGLALLGAVGFWRRRRRNS